MRSRDAVDQLAAQLEGLWEALVAPSWPQLRDLLERDVLYRSRLLAEGGLAGLFADLEPLGTLREHGSWSHSTPTGRESWAATACG